MADHHAQRIGVRWVIKQLPFPLMVVLVIVGIVSTFEPILNGWVFGQLVKIDFHNMGTVGRYVLMATGAYFVTYVSLYLYLRIKQRVVRILNQALKTVYFTTSMAEAGTKVTEVSDTINQVTNVGKQIEQNYFVALMDMVQEIIGVIVVVIFIVKINAILSLIYVLISALSLLPSHFGRNRLAKNSEKWSAANAALMLNMKDLFQGRADILNFKAWPAFFARFRQHLTKEEQDYERLNDFQYSMQFISWMFAIASFLFPMFIGLWFMAQGWFGVTTSVIVTLTMTADSVIGGVRRLSGYQSQIVGTSQLRVLPIVKAFAAPIADEKPVTLAEPESVKGHLTIKNLTVVRDQHLILDAVNLNLKPDAKILVTGPSGVGKSTLLKAITGQLTAQGTVLFNNKPLHAGDFVLVSQSVWLFSGTLRDNVTLYQDYSDEAVLRVLQVVSLDKELGTGILDFEIVDNGSNLSGGQAQRIGIARGLLRQSPVFLLDEISASLDQANADKIHKLIYALPVTVIEVAHHYNAELAQAFGVETYELVDHTLQLKK